MTNETEMGTPGSSPFNFGPRLTLTFVALIVLILGGNALVVWQFYLTRNETDRLTSANRQLIAVLGLQANLLSFHRRLDDLARSMDVRRVVTEAASLRAAIQEQTQQTRTAIANLPSETVVDPSFLPTLDTIDVTLPSEIEAIVELAKSGDWGAIQPRVATQLNPIETQTAILVNSITQQASGELVRGVTQVRSVEHRILVIVPVTALSTFFIAAYFGWCIAGRFIELRLEERVNERIRIARELHDTLLQSFQGVLLKLQAATITVHPVEAREKLEGLLDQGEQAIAEGRDAVQGMRSSTVIKNDLACSFGAVGEQLAAEQNAQSPVDFSVAVKGETRDLHPIIRDEVYRIATEAIRNAFRHSGARRIGVEIHYGDRELRVRVLDNGKGMDPRVLDGGGRAGHFGLPSMQERAKLAGGKLTVGSKVDSGTEVQLTIPASRAYVRSLTPRRTIS